MDAQTVAEAYQTIAHLTPPTTRPGALDFKDLPLVRAVDPRQYEYVQALVGRKISPLWESLLGELENQRLLRIELFRWLDQLDSSYRKNPEAFIFPDPCSLLLWLWTFRFFPNYITSARRKFYFRGEACDYGPTRFFSKAARAGTPASARQDDFPNRLRDAIRHTVARSHPWEKFHFHSELGTYLVNTLSCAQALAIGQHYGCPTPLLDVTTHPEIAMYFATSSVTEGFGILGVCDVLPLAMSTSQLSLVLIPPFFARPMRQSAYFLSTTPKRLRSRRIFQTLRFRHEPNIEPLYPRWLRTVGAVDASTPMDFLQDDLGLEDILQNETLLQPPAEALVVPQASAFVSADNREFLHAAFAELVDAAGVDAVSSEGVRTSEIRPQLLYSITRHAPLHAWLYTMLLLAQPSDQRPYNDLAEALINVMKWPFEQAAPTHRHFFESLKPEDLIKLSAPYVSEPDKFVTQFPLRHWFGSTKSRRDTTREKHDGPLIFLERISTRSCLLYGPSGCGKTLMAKATFSELGQSYARLECSAAVREHRGPDLLQDALKLSNIAGVLLEDVDEAFVAWRRRKAYPDLLAALGETALVVAATTRRPERLTWQERAAFALILPCLYPSSEERLDILHLLAGRVGLNIAIDFEKLTRVTEFWSGEELARLISTLSSKGTEIVSDSVISRLVTVIAAEVSIEDRKARLRQLLRWTMRHCPSVELTEKVKEGWSAFVD